VLHLWGCSLKCVGCFNPHTWLKDSEHFTLDALVVGKELLKTRYCDGLTITGGEPLEQWEDLRRLLFWLKNDRKYTESIILYTGKEWAGLPRNVKEDLGKTVDLVVSEPFVKELAWRHCDPRSEPLKGSSNQLYHFLRGRISREDLSEVPRVEVILDGEREIWLGFPNRDIL
jgi:anaerobic ribonucleoside-triphosphate reductase activating protein